MTKKTKNPIIIVSTLAFVAFGVITTEFSLIGSLQLIADNFNVSLSQTGILLSIYAIIVALFGPFITLSFSQYNQKLVLSVAITLFIISTLISTFANSFLLMIISRILPALAHALVFSLALAMAADCFPPEKRARTVSYVALGFIVASVIGIPFASYLSSEFSWRWGFALCAIINVVSLILITIFLPNIAPKAKMTFGNQLSILKKPIVWLNMFLASTLFAALFVVYGYFAPYFSSITGMSANTISIMLMVFGALGIIGNQFFGRITTTKNISKVILVVIFAFALIYNLINLFNYNLIAMIIMISIWGMLFAATGIVAIVWCTMNAQEAPAFANSLYVSFANLGITAGAFSGAMGIKYLGISSITTIATLFLCISLFLYLITLKKMKKLKI